MQAGCYCGTVRHTRAYSESPDHSAHQEVWGCGCACMYESKTKESHVSCRGDHPILYCATCAQNLRTVASFHLSRCPHCPTDAAQETQRPFTHTAHTEPSTHLSIHIHACKDNNRPKHAFSHTQTRPPAHLPVHTHACTDNTRPPTCTKSHAHRAPGLAQRINKMGNREDRYVPYAQAPHLGGKRARKRCELVAGGVEHLQSVRQGRRERPQPIVAEVQHTQRGGKRRGQLGQTAVVVHSQLLQQKGERE